MSRLRILHLGFQDPWQPGSGGGAVRTMEVARRLAERHDITVLTSGWPGARPRVEEGVRWRHTPALTGRAATLPYAAISVAAARSARVDLVVEDFFAPVSTVGVPRWTALPVVGVVQWLFARQKARQYRLPFHKVEDWGLQQHRYLIAVSEDLALELRARAPDAQVHAVPNGVDPGLFVPPDSPPARAGIAYLGRLEIAQKGLDVLLDAVAHPALAPWSPTLSIAGDGPDEGALRARATRLGLDARVRWLGRLGPAEKAALLRRAAVVAVPSRYETFGIVAAEAMASGAPVVATDVPCLQEVARAGHARLVPPDDATALAVALASVLEDPALSQEMSTRGALAATRYDWDTIARNQESVYLEAVAEHHRRM